MTRIPTWAYIAAAALLGMIAFGATTGIASASQAEIGPFGVLTIRDGIHKDHMYSIEVLEQTPEGYRLFGSTTKTPARDVLWIDTSDIRWQSSTTYRVHIIDITQQRDEHIATIEGVDSSMIFPFGAGLANVFLTVVIFVGGPTALTAGIRFASHGVKPALKMQTHRASPPARKPKKPRTPKRSDWKNNSRAIYAEPPGGHGSPSSRPPVEFHERAPTNTKLDPVAKRPALPARNEYQIIVENEDNGASVPNVQVTADDGIEIETNYLDEGRIRISTEHAGLTVAVGAPGFERQIVEVVATEETVRLKPILQDVEVRVGVEGQQRPVAGVPVRLVSATSRDSKVTDSEGRVLFPNVVQDEEIMVRTDVGKPWFSDAEQMLAGARAIRLTIAFNHNVSEKQKRLQADLEAEEHALRRQIHSSDPAFESLVRAGMKALVLAPKDSKEWPVPLMQGSLDPALLVDSLLAQGRAVMEVISRIMHDRSVVSFLQRNKNRGFKEPSLDHARLVDIMRGDQDAVKNLLLDSIRGLDEQLNTLARNGEILLPTLLWDASNHHVQLNGSGPEDHIARLYASSILVAMTQFLIHDTQWLERYQRG